MNEMGSSDLLDVRSRYRHRKGAPGGKTGLIESGDMPATRLKVARRRTCAITAFSAQ